MTDDGGGVRRTRVVLYVCFAGFAVAALFGLATLMLHLNLLPFSRVVGLVLLFFGLFKIAIAVDAVHAPTAVAPQSDQRQEMGSPAIFRLWVMYKFVPATLAILAAAYLFANGSASLDALIR